MKMECHYCGKIFDNYGFYGIVWCCSKCKKLDKKNKLKKTKEGIKINKIK